MLSNSAPWMVCVSSDVGSLDVTKRSVPPVFGVPAAGTGGAAGLAVAGTLVAATAAAAAGAGVGGTAVGDTAAGAAGAGAHAATNPRPAVATTHFSAVRRFRGLLIRPAEKNAPGRRLASAAIPGRGSATGRRASPVGRCSSQGTVPR